MSAHVPVTTVLHITWTDLLKTSILQDASHLKYWRYSDTKIPMHVQQAYFTETEQIIAWNLVQTKTDYVYGPTFKDNCTNSQW